MKFNIENKKKASKGFSSFEDLFSYYMPGVLIVVLMILMCTEICLRWAFRTSLMGVVEMVEVSMVVITFASLAGIQREKGHVRMNLLIDRLSGKRIGVLIETLNPLFILTMCAILLYPFIKAVIRFKQFNETTEYFLIPLWVVGIFMPLGLLVLCIRLISQAISEGRKIVKGRDDDAI
jgi:C4-dicarboxylate transporter DctQ subunit